MSVTRYEDLALSYLLISPSGAPPGATAPLVVLMHGRGADADNLADLAPLLDPGGYRFVLPNAPRAFEPVPGMTVGYTWFDGWPPEAHFAESSAMLRSFMADIDKRHPAPPGKTVISGFSQGGMMALDLGFRLESVAGVVCMSGALNENDPPPLDERVGRPVLLVHGTDDDRIPVVSARRTRRVLEEHHLEPEYHEFAMGHEVTMESLEVVAHFIARCLG